MLSVKRSHKTAEPAISVPAASAAEALAAQVFGGTPRLVVEHLTVAQLKTGAEIVQNVSISVAAGEILGVIGESGSGKTTLGLAMIGHTRRGLQITSGSVKLDGEDILSMPAERLHAVHGSAMAYVPQDPGTALNPARRIGSQLHEAMEIHGWPPAEAAARISELFIEVGLTGEERVLRSYPHQLSGGQQQRLAIAMAFACRPSLIVLDEPTTGLDVATQRTVLDTIKRLCGDYGVAGVYVSHDAAVVGELSDRIAVVYSGRIIEYGTAEDVFGSPQHPYTRGLLRAVPMPGRSGPLVGIGGLPPQPGRRPDGCAFQPRCELSFGRCETERPKLYSIGTPDGPAHLARCLLVEDAPTRRISVREPDAAVQETNTAAVAAQVPMPGEDAVLECVGLSASYGARKALFDMSLSLPAEQCVAIVGESGSGKTTLARCMSGLHTNWEGTLSYRGQALSPGVRRRPKEMLREMQYIFQNPHASLNPRRTVGASIAQWLDQFTTLSRRDRDQKVRDTISDVSLPESMINAYPDQLSGGQRQRVAIARALVVSPSLLICDEITSALDVSVQASVIELLRELQAEQSLSLLFITHNLPLVRSIAQQVVVVSGGQIVESGSVADVLDNPQDEYTQRLLSNVAQFDFAET